MKFLDGINHQIFSMEKNVNDLHSRMWVLPIKIKHDIRASLGVPNNSSPIHNFLGRMKKIHLQ
jgi:hypothetical protein